MAVARFVRLEDDDADKVDVRRSCNGTNDREKSGIEARSQFAAHKKVCSSAAVDGDGSDVRAWIRDGQWETPAAE